MYQSLYRKYRPKNFDDVVGQKIIIRILKNSINKNQITHAYLFTGPRGTGKTSVAHILAKTVNCTDLDEYKTCDKCVSCTQINNRQNIDIVEIDAASNNGVDEIRELKSKVSLIPSTSKYKVYIIDEVHMLTIGAFNALLKTLEEPPAHVIFILATTEPHKIPETILSRCQKFNFKKIDDKSMLDRLSYICKEEGIKIEPPALAEIIRFSSGGMRDAISLLEQAYVYSKNEITINDIHEINGTLPQYQLKDLIINIVNKNLDEIFKLIEKYDHEGKNFIKLVEEIILFLKNIIISKNIPDYFIDDISREIYDYKNYKLSNEEILKKIAKINDSLIEMKNYNHPKLIFELLMISLVGTEKPKTKQLRGVVEQINNPKLVKEVILDNKVNKNKETQKNIKNKEKSNEKDEIIEKLIEIRVNNTFVKPSKSLLKKLRNDLEISRKYVLDDNYGKIASLLLDGRITGASAKNIVFVYSSEGMKRTFNNNISIIENFISIIFGKHYKIISLNENDWSFYRSEFKSKLKKYVYIEEPEEIKKYLNNQLEKTNKKDEIQTLFDDIIVYKN